MANLLDTPAKVRQAYVFLIRDALGADRAGLVYDGKNSKPKTVPNVTCKTGTAREEPYGSGNFHVDVEIEVRTPASVDVDAEEEPEDESDSLAYEVFAALMTDDQPAKLMLHVEDFTVFGISSEDNLDRSEDEDCWVDTFKRTIYCCGTSF